MTCSSEATRNELLMIAIPPTCPVWNFFGPSFSKTENKTFPLELSMIEIREGEFST